MFKVAYHNNKINGLMGVRIILSRKAINGSKGCKRVSRVSIAKKIQEEKATTNGLCESSCHCLSHMEPRNHALWEKVQGCDVSFVCH